MDLHILGGSEASQFMPTKPTGVVRIFSSFDLERLPLQENPLFVYTDEYTFDDNDGPDCQMGPVDITEDIAKSIVERFGEFRERIEALLIHCSRGRNRSPAVGIAINSLFDLGHDDKVFKTQFPLANRTVYNMITRVGRDIVCTIAKE